MLDAGLALSDAFRVWELVRTGIGGTDELSNNVRRGAGCGLSNNVRRGFSPTKGVVRCSTNGIKGLGFLCFSK